jgi:DNA-binding winged helix-turn-helix (wHTH) protein
MRHAGRVMSRTLITEYAWGYHFDPGTNIVDVVINHLRKKVDAKHGNRLITTVRGVGYMIKDEKADGRRDEKREDKRETTGRGSHPRTPAGGGRGEPKDR